MTKIDLVTGFLGAGKTTFIKKYAQYFMDQGMNIGILENDFGSVNVDRMLLKDMEGEKCTVEMITGGCDRECHRRRFRTKLIAMGMSGYDRVIIEPSGIFDMDEFFDTLHESPLDNWYEIGNIIAIVDVKLENNLSEQADYILASEVANAGCVLLSKTKEAEREQVFRTIGHIVNAVKNIGCDRIIDKDIILKDWSSFTDEDFLNISTCGYVHASYEKKYAGDEEIFHTLYFMNTTVPEKDLSLTIKKIFWDKNCGQVFRVKGYLKTERENDWIEINATKKNVSINHVPYGQEVFIVIGENLKEEAIREYFCS
ncbi:MAG: GTP-binding protein [Lachnospiraceae bacterium]|nr:GTP-binding protein [Lachnospiraceae bacterium]MDY5497702.1 GTP-binding protein [Anaerobutyricum sp.]